jgi:hypothetical protein
LSGLPRALLIEWARRADWEELSYPLVFTVSIPLVWAAAQVNWSDTSPEQLEGWARTAAWPIGVVAFCLAGLTVARFILGKGLSIAALSLATLVWFLCMLALDEFRAEAIVALWSLVGAGVVAWWILEQHAEELADIAWVRRNTLHVRRGSMRIVRACSSLLVDYLNLDEQRHRDLLQLSQTNRATATAALEQQVELLEQKGPAAVGSFRRVTGRIAADLERRLGELDAIDDESDDLLARFVNLESALTDLRDTCRTYLSSPHAKPGAQPPFEIAWRDSAVPVIVRRAFRAWLEAVAVVTVAERRTRDDSRIRLRRSSD